MILRIDDTDVERNTEASLTSIFEGLRWLDLGWDEEYRQSERLALHREMAEAIFQKGSPTAISPPRNPAKPKGGADHRFPWLPTLFNSDMRDLPAHESDRRAAAGEPFALRFRVPREAALHRPFHRRRLRPAIQIHRRYRRFRPAAQRRHAHLSLASCADDAALRISHVIRGQDHLTNTFKHVLIFEAAGVAPPQFAHLPLLVAPDGTKLSKRRHGPVVSVTTYRDAGFLPHAFVNFLCLLGWSPKDDREQMTRQESSTRSRSKASTAPTPWSISRRKTRSIPRPCG
jgi:glutamyl-tRNA synthetase